MNTKTLIGAIIVAIISFLLGYVLYGLLLADFFDSPLVHYDNLAKKEPVLWEIAVANFIWALLLSYVISIAGIRSPVRGFITGFIIFFLFTFGARMFQHATLNLAGFKISTVDALCAGIIGGIGGAVLGWWFSRPAKG